MYALDSKCNSSLQNPPKCLTNYKKPFYKRATFSALETNTSLLKSIMAQLTRAIKNLKPSDPVKPLLGTFSKEIIRLKQKTLSIKMFTAPPSIIAKMCKPKSPQ